MDSCSQPALALGFFTVVDRAPHGLIGGLLVVDAAARPIEFHCTAPVRANRAQEILYGATLSPYLYGEQIGLTLLRAAQARPQAVFTDCAAAMGAADLFDAPLWFVLAQPAEPKSAELQPAELQPADSRSAETSVAASPTAAAAQAAALRVDSAHPQPVPAGLSISQLGRNLVARGAAKSPTAALLGLQGEQDPNQFAERVAAAATALDLSEPFERIRAAIDEAQRGGR